jgi:hypothetical protein
MEPLDQRRRNRLPVNDEWPKGPRMKQRAHRILWPQLRYLHQIEKVFPYTLRSLVGHQDVPMPIKYERRIRLLLSEHEL